MKGDTPLRRKTVENMTGEELRVHVIRMREQRMKSVVEHKKAQDALNKERHDKATAKLLKQTEMLQKELDRADRAIEKVEKRTALVVALREELKDIPTA